MFFKKRDLKKEIKQLKEDLRYHKRRDLFFSEQWLLIKKRMKEMEVLREEMLKQADTLLSLFGAEVQKIYKAEQKIENNIRELKKMDNN